MAFALNLWCLLGKKNYRLLFLPWRYQEKQGWCLHPKPMGCPSSSQPSSYSWDEPGAQSVHLLLHHRCFAAYQSSRGRMMFCARPLQEQMFLLCICRRVRKAQQDNHVSKHTLPPHSALPSLGKGAHACVPREHDSNNLATFQRALLGIMTAFNKHCTSVSQGESSGL